MTEQDKQDLRELQEELLAAEQSPWQPMCVARMFARDAGTPFVLTMQGWIDLEARRCPLLVGELPEAEEAIEEFEAAFAAFGHTATTPEACEPHELVMLGHMMMRAIRDAFAMQVRLSPPEGCQIAAKDNGMGQWLPVMACLGGQMGMSLAEARAMPAGEAFALIAAHRCNEGWSVAGEDYATREVGEDG